MNSLNILFRQNGGRILLDGKSVYGNRRIIFLVSSFFVFAAPSVHEIPPSETEQDRLAVAIRIQKEVPELFSDSHHSAADAIDPEGQYALWESHRQNIVRQRYPNP
jgi:hypothetical protein